MKIDTQLKRIGIIPVVVIEDAKDAVPLAEALCEGGLPCAEITFRTMAAEDSIRLMTKQFPDMLVGAGTVLNAQQVERAIEAGAKFLVSPGLNADHVRHSLKRGIPFIPGVQTPTEIEQALELGIDVLKFFPAEPSGGLKMIRALAAPFPTVSFIPTGGINGENVQEYLSCDRILACGGSWMVPKDLIKAGEFKRIRDKAKEASAIVRRSRGEDRWS